MDELGAALTGKRDAESKSASASKSKGADAERKSKASKAKKARSEGVPRSALPKGSVVRRVAGGGKVQYVASLPDGRMVRVKPPGPLESAAPWVAVAAMGYGAYRLGGWLTGGGAQGALARRTRGRRVVYDRQLGGRAVVLEGDAAKAYRPNVWSDASAAAEARAYGASAAGQASSLSAAAQLAGGGGKAAVAPSDALPEWWPSEAPRKAVDSKFGQEAADAVLRSIANARMSGRDPSLLDLQKLRSVCSDFGVAVAVASATERDAIMRSAVGVAVGAVEKGTGLSSASEAQGLVAGLAGDLQVESRRAATLCAAAVAARCRGAILQAVARVRAGDDLGAIAALKGMARLFAALPPAKNSAELSLLADTLGPRAKISERETLLKLYAQADLGDTGCLAAEALGITSS